ncbi:MULTISPECIES: hypothetical protein [unclassified Burkholderia]|uniref:hypothetical protein n=1 Tax=unclassified Burkholderia TaxID=2613784 RepID=UPI001E35EFC3|nr:MULTISPECIES: hypothetical protein [unclassified Burkholderia]UEP32399.1 hypothetical protein LMA01_33665 [Burkholderia sp. B21-007]UEP46543.1 hypothetical protein LMA02_32610 [Burkholderia sp. B21-005]
MPVIAGKGVARQRRGYRRTPGLHAMNAMRNAPFRQHLNARCDERRDPTARVIEQWRERANTAA